MKDKTKDILAIIAAVAYVVALAYYMLFYLPNI